MMRVLLILIACFWYNNDCAGQAQKRYIVKAGEAPDEAIPGEAKYIFPSFTEGTAFLRSGASVKQQFNYNHLLDEMQFLNTGGDTLAIADPGLIKYISIDSLVFYYDKGYLRQVVQIRSHKLAVKQQMIQIPDKVGTAYGGSSGSSAVTTYSSIYASDKVHRLKVDRDVLFQTVTSWYIGNQYNRFEKADKKGFYNIFPSNRDAIRKYIAKNNPDFNKEADLEQLLRFCTE
ncbi:hypothetical protein [Agriterribacter sp.]|uniref:hypothetical protein n=1 Tax=Agriterribacter sp. TaxID=2821509 RepID=UPI002B686FB2|nr:hypothetical protein [Agriterribacter sp.]HRO44642.1 hypothetical protein [Agriterribacter sp.]HRQ16079.1 hypothetical protein [Agriterribacter sp.]